MAVSCCDDGETKLKYKKYKWHFARLINATEAPKCHECPTNFVQMRGTFGHIVSAWNKKREQFGPGFYLYLGVRRGMQLYPEHRFVTLIWGIEAFHRKKHHDPSSDAIKIQVCRIIEQVSDRKDKRWLKGVLKHAHEPSLEQRIFDVLTAMPINIDNTKIRKFARECAERRNEMSHFGAQRRGGNYTDFVSDLEKKSAALSILYHTLILHEIGIDEKIFNWWIYEGFRSYPIKRTLVEVGLLDKSVFGATRYNIPACGGRAFVNGTREPVSGLRLLSLAHESQRECSACGASFERVR